MPNRQGADEKILLRHSQDGDLDAYGELYDLYAGNIYRFLAAHLSDPLDAEDITSDVFLRAWRALPAFHERGVPFQAYLLRIARNALVDHYRKSAKENQVNLESMEVVLPNAETEPAEVVISKLEHQHLHYVLEQLRPDYRTVLVLRFLNNLTPAETARVMKRTTGAVRVLQHRALASLRKLLTGLDL